MNVENTKAQMKKGVLELCILSIIAEGEIYSTDIINKLEDSKLLVAQGTLYPLLTRLKNAGLLTYRWEESETGHPRKYFQITEIGEDFLKGLIETWNELLTAVNQSTKNITSK